MKIRPMGDYVLVRLERETTSPGGIVIPHGVDQPRIGVVVAMGPGRFKSYADGREPMDIKEGDRLILGKFAGEQYEVKGEKLFLIRQGEIRAVIEED